ncbi:MAG: response regulator [Candidatus Gracilibacteria bacterium]|nr:response regulator [Candidatus Peregrinibacteria bacterium]
MARKMHALLVDDEKTMLLFYRSALKKIGGELDAMEASNGQEGLRLLKMFTPDFVIVDCRMPVMDGPEFCKMARGLNFQVPIIMVTAEERFRVRDDLRENDIYYLQKPIDMGDTFFCRRFEDELHKFVHGFLSRSSRTSIIV